MMQSDTVMPELLDTVAASGRAANHLPVRQLSPSLMHRLIYRRAAARGQTCRGKRIEHQHHIDPHGQGLPQIRDGTLGPRR